MRTLVVLAFVICVASAIMPPNFLEAGAQLGARAGVGYPFFFGGGPQAGVVPLSAPAPSYPAQSVSVPQGGSVSVAEVPTGFVVSLPPPPQFNPDVVTSSGSSCFPNCHDNKVAAEGSQIQMVFARMRLKQQALDDHDDWLDQAKSAVEKLQKYIDTTQSNRDQLNDELNNLTVEKESLTKQQKRELLQSQLENAKKALRDIESQSDSLAAAHRAITRSQGKLQKSIDHVGGKLALTKQEVEDKISEFQDAANALSSVSDQEGGAQALMSEGDAV
jgi:prefoldin subunit 5